MPSYLNERLPQPGYDEPAVYKRPDQGAATQRLKGPQAQAPDDKNGSAPKDRGFRD